MGAAGGALIGTGIGASAGAASVSAAMATATSMAVSGGTGALASAESYMVGNKVTGNRFDASDFAITAGGGVVEGAITAAVPGAGMMQGINRAAISGLVGVGTYAAQQSANGQAVEAGQAARAFGVANVAGGVGDLVSGGWTGPGLLDLRTPISSQDYMPTTWSDPMLNGREVSQEMNSLFKRAIRTTARNATIEILSETLPQ